MEIIKRNQLESSELGRYISKYGVTQEEVNKKIELITQDLKTIPKSRSIPNIIKINTQADYDLCKEMYQNIKNPSVERKKAYMGAYVRMEGALPRNGSLNWSDQKNEYWETICQEKIAFCDFILAVDDFLKGREGNGWMPHCAIFFPVVRKHAEVRDNMRCKMSASLDLYEEKIHVKKAMIAKFGDEV